MWYGIAEPLRVNFSYVCDSVDDPYYRRRDNLASGRRTHQSSTYGTASSELAVDNNMYSCTQTNVGQAKPSWIVYIMERAYVDVVFIVNRVDCCGTFICNIIEDKDNIIVF